VKTPWIRPRKYWFVLTPDSLDYYSSSEKGARRLGSLVLTSLCSVLWPDRQTYKETGRVPAPLAGLRLRIPLPAPASLRRPERGCAEPRGGGPWGAGGGGRRVSCLSLAGYWSVTVFGRKHCYRLYTQRLREAVRWVCAVQKVIDSKAPVQTPTQLLMRDVEVSPRLGAACARSRRRGRGGCPCQALGRAAPPQRLPPLRPRRSTAAALRCWSRSTAATPSCATPAAPSTLPCCPSPTAARTKAVRGGWGARSLVPHPAGRRDGRAAQGGRARGWALSGPGCGHGAWLLAGGPGEAQGAVNPRPIPQPPAPAATPRCATRP